MARFSPRFLVCLRSCGCTVFVFEAGWVPNGSIAIHTCCVSMARPLLEKWLVGGGVP